VHYRAGDFTKSREFPTACMTRGFSTPDTDLVTCPGCRATVPFAKAEHGYREVVEALRYPKEDHPCLLNQRTP
jgi:hypothetical protein